jgi:hypothetical protein
MTISKITRARDMLMRNGCMPPYILFSDNETLTSLRNDPRYSSEEFAYEKSSENDKLKTIRRSDGIRNKRVTTMHIGGVPAAQNAQISYLVATDYIKTFEARPWTPSVTPAVQNPTLFYISANGRAE